MPYKRGKKWQGRIMVSGQIHTRDGFSTKKDAAEWESQKRKQTLSGKEQESLDLLSLTVEYLTYAKKYGEKTYQEKKSLCNRIIEHWKPNTPIQKIAENPKIVLDFLTTRMKSQSANAANKDRKNILAMWNWGEKFYKKFFKDLDNPIIGIPRFAHNRKPQYTPPIEDVLKVIMACTREERFFLSLYLHTGARRGEIFNCAVEDVLMDQRQVRLWTKKSKDGSRVPRYITMSDELYDNMKWWLQNRPIKNTEWLVVNSDKSSPHYGKPFKVRRRFLKGLCKRAGVRAFGFHSLRRYTASLLAMGRTPTRVIQEVLGHANMKTTEIYIHNLATDQRQYMNLLQTPEDVDTNVDNLSRKS